MAKKPIPPEASVHPKRIAPRLRAVREALRLDKAEIADSIGCDRSHWIKYENGDRPIPAYYLERLWLAYGFDFNFFLGGDMNGVPPEHRVVVAGLLRSA